MTGPKNDHPTPPKKALRSRPSVLISAHNVFTIPGTTCPAHSAYAGGTLTEKSLPSNRLCLHSLGRFAPRARRAVTK